MTTSSTRVRSQSTSIAATTRVTRWQELEGILKLPEEVRKNWWFPNPPHLGHILQIFVHPDATRLLYVCVEHGGIVRSSDGGETWEDVSQGIDYLDPHMVATVPHRFDRFLAATAQGFYATPDPAEGWQRSENRLHPRLLPRLHLLPAQRSRTRIRPC